MAEDEAPGEPFNLVLEHLKRIQAKLDSMALDILDIKARQSASDHNDASLMLQMSSFNTRLDRLDERVARIERRLDLIEA